MDPAEAYWLWQDEEDEEMEIEHQFMETAVVAAALVVLGSEAARAEYAERRRAHRFYLRRPQLLPDPRENTPWQALYATRDDAAYIVTMGIDVDAFHLILASGFEEQWNSEPVSRNDVASTGNPRPERRSLDAAGALGLVLHYLNSTMREISLQQIFALIPSTVSRYIDFSLRILLNTLRTMPPSYPGTRFSRVPPSNHGVLALCSVPLLHGSSRLFLTVLSRPIPLRRP